MEISVQARENSVTGGNGKEVASYAPGTVLVLSCNPEDQWSLLTGNRDFSTNANGLPTRHHARGNQAFRTGTLVGSFDNGATFFSVGTVLTTIVTATNRDGNAATLKLYCWDSDNHNNSGAISVYVQAQ